MAVAGRSGQWEEGSGRRGAVGQWRWEEGRRIWILFFSLSANGEFDKFGLSGIEGDSRKGKTFFASQVWWEKEWDYRFIEWGILSFTMWCVVRLEKMYSLDVCLLLYGWGGDGSPRVQIARMCSSGSCFGWRRLHRSGVV